MDLSIAVPIFAVGFILGYAVRDGISRHRRARAKRSRVLFWDSARCK